MNSGWIQHQHKLTNKHKAARKRKRNRAWKAVHRAFKRADAKEKIANQVADLIQNLGASELSVEADKPSFLKNLTITKAKEND